MERSTTDENGSQTRLWKKQPKKTAFGTLLDAFWAPGPPLGRIWESRGNHMISRPHFVSLFSGFGIPLGITFGHFGAWSWQRTDSGTLQRAAGVVLEKDIEIWSISQPLLPPKLSSRVHGNTIFNISPYPQIGSKLSPKIDVLGDLWHLKPSFGDIFATILPEPFLALFFGDDFYQNVLQKGSNLLRAYL